MTADREPGAPPAVGGFVIAFIALSLIGLIVRFALGAREGHGAVQGLLGSLGIAVAVVIVLLLGILLSFWLRAVRRRSALLRADPGAALVEVVVSWETSGSLTEIRDLLGTRGPRIRADGYATLLVSRRAVELHRGAGRPVCEFTIPAQRLTAATIESTPITTRLTTRTHRTLVMTFEVAGSRRTVAVLPVDFRGIVPRSFRPAALDALAPRVLDAAGTPPDRTPPDRTRPIGV